MSQRARTGKKRFSLSVYISLLLALTAILPVFATVGSLEFFLRPALISQVSADMERDAQTRVQLIDTYFSERLNDIKTLSQSTPIKNLLANDQNSRNTVFNILFTAQHRDVANYISLSLLDSQGNVILSYPSAPLPHGKYLILPDALKQLQQSGKVVISDVFYDLTANKASVDLYARVIDDNFQPLGFIRASLGLHRVWEPVDSETQANGAGSYAFILDQNGVRIAYTNTDHSGFTHANNLFKAIAPLSEDLQQRIKDEDLYGNDSTPVSVIADQKLVDMQRSAQSIFAIDPIGQNQTYQAARYSSTVVPWTYFILKPMNTVTGIADQQLLSIFLIVTLMLISAIIVGLLTGRRIALPILRSVALLRDNSQSLKTLANEEHVVAAEQSWMVEASQIALESVKYYSKATDVAAQRIHTIGTELAQNGYMMDQRQFGRAVKEIVDAASYIERAVKHQESMNEKLATSLRVTTQAADQLTTGAKSTDDAATQLEQIVGKLTSVVGE